MTTLNNLVTAVIAQSGLSATGFNDCTNNGAGGGFDGFTWHTDTTAFYDVNKADIVSLLEYNKEECYGDVGSLFGMISNFGLGKTLTVVTSDFEEDEDGEINFDCEPEFNTDVMFAVYDEDNAGLKAFEEDTTFKNLMAWFALEEVSRVISDLLEEAEEDCYHDGGEGMNNLEYVKSLGVDCEEWEENNK